MGDGPIEKITDAPAKAAGFAKSNPWAFGLVVLGVALLILKYPDKVKSFLTGLPLVGPLFSKAIG
jgi:hypothetical protein